MNFIRIPLFLFFIGICKFSAAKDIHADPTSPTHGTIIFSTIGRANYNFDIYTLPAVLSPPSSDPKEFKITDGISLNFNGFFPDPNSSLFSLLAQNQTLLSTKPYSSSSPPFIELIYVTERNGTSKIYYDVVHDDSLSQLRSRSALEIPARLQIPMLSDARTNGQVWMKDKPSLAGEYLIYMSTHEDSEVSRLSWAAVYSTHVRTGSTRRLTPDGVVDFSPAVSPSGEWTAVASLEERVWDTEVDELGTNIYMFLTRNGSSRIKIVEHGGWPSWMDDYTIYFHRRSYDDGWWSVYRAILPRVGRVSMESVVVERVTPPGLHAFTPATSPENKDFIAIATRRPESKYRYIELFDLVRKEFKEVTRPVSPQTHHFNPFLSPDSTRIGYHKCRGVAEGSEGQHHILENLQSPIPGISLFRVEGTYPSLSPLGDRIVYAMSPGLYVVDLNGSNRRELYKEEAFATAWDPVREGVIYFSAGPIFGAEGTRVDIISMNVDDENLSYKKLTEGGDNNAFPSLSPDGKRIVFRSGRSGHKNLFIMDAVEGEKGGLQRLTEGPWTDTMCNWSPDGEWIAFASNRENPGGWSFAIYMIHPNGTGLRRVIRSGIPGRANHPWFSPDGKRIVFATDYAGISAEPISYPHQYQPYGEVFVANVDGSGIQRMTHNSYEDGTPTWGAAFIRPRNVARPIDDSGCTFDDCHWLSTDPESGAGEDLMAPTRTRCGWKF
ncbi:hypothetical protein Ancab_002410 [Ancistrocladus abbreviatus]